MDYQASQVTESGGVSRSGRVRKKSARLTEFESSEEVEVKISPKKSKGSKQSASSLKLTKTDSLSDFSNDSEDSDFGSKDESDDWNQVENSPLMNDLIHDDISKDDVNYNSQTSSLYFSEKKRMNNTMLPMAKNVQKTERKDKGISRCNAYILWAKEARPEVIEQYPQLDFTDINKKLGEMWTNAPQAQKQIYNRMAKRLALQGDCPTPTSQMIRTGKSPQKKTMPAVNRKTMKHKEKEIAESTLLPQAHSSLPHKSASVMHKTLSDPSAVGSSSTFKVNGTTPIDVSAHLKLLGESLNNIGQKLKENEGQIAVSGSLSVLLDSMLCVLGPLTCLTNQLEETKGAIDDATLNGILDNIAYIMPGIV